MADPSMTLWTREQIAILAEPSTGQLRLSRLSGTDRVYSEVGTTGDRDITSLCTGFTTGDVYVSRSGDTVTWRLIGVKVDSTGIVSLFDTTAQDADAGLAGFLPRNRVAQGIGDSLGAPNNYPRLEVQAGGTVQIRRLPVGNTGFVTLTFNTGGSTWPSTLPGVAYGETAVQGV